MTSRRFPKSFQECLDVNHERSAARMAYLYGYFQRRDIEEVIIRGSPIRYRAPALEGVPELRIAIRVGTWDASEHGTPVNPMVPLESLSVIEDGKIGWTLDERFDGDWILYTWDERISERYWLIQHEVLRRTYAEHWPSFKAREKRSWTPRRGKQKDYHSRFVYVPLETIQAYCDNRIA